MSTVRANAVLDSSGGNTATINGMTPTAQSLQGFRNRIINGDMRIDQRNNGAAITTGFSVDRWKSDWAAGTFLTYQRVTSSVPGFTNALRITTNTARTLIATDIYVMRQFIEGFNVADLNWGTANAQPVTISFWVRASIAGTYSFSVSNASGNRSYVTTFTINAANTNEFKTITVPGDTTGTWSTDNSAGIVVGFEQGAGSNFVASSTNTWTAIGAQKAAGTVSIVSTLGATFEFTGVQLEAGSVATPFERRDYGRELMMCQRYFQMKSTVAIPVSATSNIFPATHFMVQMRAIPTLAVSFDVGTGATYGALANANSVYQIQNHSAVATATISLNSEL